MREKYESLALADLKAIAKSRGIKGVSTMKKADVVEAMLLLDEKEKAEERKDLEERSASAERRGQEEQKTLRERRNPEERNGSAAGRRRPEDRRIPEERRTSEDRRIPEERRTSEDRRIPEERRTSEERRVPEERRTSEERRVSEDRRTSEDRPDTRRPEDRSKAASSFDRNAVYDVNCFPPELDSGLEANGILEVMPDGYGFIRCENYMPGDNDVYVAPSQIRRFGLKTGDILVGNKRTKTQQEKFSALLYIKSVNGFTVEETIRRSNFEEMTPIFPDERIKLEVPGASIAMRVMDLVSPIGKGQRGMIVSPPKAGKTTLLKQVAKSIQRNEPKMHMLILLIDERPEEVTDIKEAIQGSNV